MNPLLTGYLLTNIVTMFIYGWDKRKAIRHEYRISEKMLLFFAFIGPIGAILGMFLFHHKTQKLKFKFAVPFFIVLHIGAVLFSGSIYGESTLPSAWAKEEYGIALQKGYITNALKTDLQGNITRKDFVELIMNSYEMVMGEVPDITLNDNPFTDIQSLPIIKAEKLGIVSGTGGTLFYPEKYLDREQMIVILARMNRAIEIRTNERILKYQDIKLDFEDADQISTWALESFQLGILNNVIAGVGNNLLGPHIMTSKEQAVILNLRLMLRYESNQMLKDYVQESTTSVAEEPVENKIGVVNVAILNMRSTPNLTNSTNIIRKLKLSETLEIIEQQGDWYYVKASGDLEGYVYAEYVIVKDPNAVSSNSELVDEIIAYAKQFQGTRYVYGGSSLTNGTDCSGFTMRVMQHFGITLSRSSAGQASNGVAVSREDLKPGDIILYGFSGYVSHAAIYIGNNQVIHANTTYGVSITPAFGWLNKPFIGIRRVVY